jgi:hypothetical protein
MPSNLIVPAGQASASAARRCDTISITCAVEVSAEARDVPAADPVAGWSCEELENSPPPGHVGGGGSTPCALACAPRNEEAMVLISAVRETAKDLVLTITLNSIAPRPCPRAQ